tara:strand:+ start:89 stop:595 length:507 start_codon:yes stop_codon:yes gene_type:complete
MAKKKDNNVFNISQDEIDAMENFTKSLPSNAYEMVPDDKNVTIEISGFFYRSILRTLDHIVAVADDKEVIRATEFLKLDYDSSKINESLLTSLDTALWTITTLMNEFNVQARAQKKTVVYDKTAVSKLLQERTYENKLKPLTTEEIQKRQEMEKLAKEKKDKEESNED